MGAISREDVGSLSVEDGGCGYLIGVEGGVIRRFAASFSNLQKRSDDVMNI